MQLQRSKGFSALVTLLVIGLVAVVSLGGWVVWQKSQGKEETNQTTNTAKHQKAGSTTKPVPDPYEGWQTYSNEQYGISFRYPEEWVARDFSRDGQAPDTPMTVEFGIYLEREEQAKYNTTVSIEVFDDPIIDLDKFYSDNLVKREPGILKGKPAIYYSQQDSGKYQMKRRLFEVNAAKTYLFESINEGTNLEIDTKYWSKFDLIFESFKIDK